ncbi:MAG: hypothetical protein HQ564_10495 [Candidatus Saganbacteria bacterium]|nr:hypothetical protein [Candidatus Saganbacteria bacterium]
MIDYKKAYYYIICLIAFFVLFWGIIDFGSATVSYISNNNIRSKGAEQSQSLDDFYQGKMIRERMGDSLVRIIIAGGVFIFCRKKTAQFEGGA